MRSALVTLTMCLLVLPANAKYSGGTGEPNDPYQIATAAELIALGETPEDYDKHFVLTADIDLDPNLPGRKVFQRAVIAPASSSSDHKYIWSSFFRGAFDGAGHTIHNLRITGDGCLGLFALSHGSIANLGLEAVEVQGTDFLIGGLVASNEGIIVGCHSNGSVNGTSSVGGLVGSSRGTIVGSYSRGSVSGTRVVGGLVGDNPGSIVASYSSSSVSVSGPLDIPPVGGLVGYNAGSIVASYSSGSMRVSMSRPQDLWSVGGLVGYSFYGRINASFWDIQTSGQSKSAGGTGKTTAEMQKRETFLRAGWDCVDEMANGTCDYWRIPPGEYPRLRYQDGNHPFLPEGRGTADQPYLIRDARDLGAVWLEPLAYHRLVQSIDLAGITWPVAVISCFGGSFDGNGCIVHNLNIQGNGYLGLFGHVNRAQISHLGMERVDVNGTGNYVGSLVGYNVEGRMDRVYSHASVNGMDFVGGLAGYNSNGEVRTSHSHGSVHGRNYVGGLVGYNDRPRYIHGESADLSDSYSFINASYSRGSVTATGEQVGGLVGFNDRARINASYSRGSVSAAGDQVGGLVGCNHRGRIDASYSRGSVSGAQGMQSIGGLVGRRVVGSIKLSFWDIQTSGQTQSAGGTGKTTAEMQTASTFLEAGWDFAGETANGTEDVWWILEGRDYPRLWWERVLGDDFGDGKAEPLWMLFQPEPEAVRLKEVNGRLEVEAVAQPENVDAIYVANGWRLDATKDFALRVDFHFSKRGPGDGRVTLGVVPVLDPAGMQWAELEAGCFDTGPFFLYEVRDGFWVQERVTERSADNGTLYLSYNPDTDELYFSYTGYGKPNAWQTVPGLLKGRWASEAVYVILSGGSEGMALEAGDAWLDNLVVNAGAVESVEPVALPDPDGAESGDESE